MAGHDDLTEFRAFADAKDHDKIKGLMDAGLVKTGTLVLMELDIDSFIRSESDPLSGPMKISLSRNGVGEVELYDADKYGLDEYLKANRSGFAGGIPGERSTGAVTSESTIREELSYKNASVYVLRLDGKIVSSVTVWDHDDETVSTENIFTIPEYRNRGFATRVLATALFNAGERGLKKARLTVYEDNDTAIKMYETLGYTGTKLLIEFGA